MIQNFRVALASLILLSAVFGGSSGAQDLRNLTEQIQRLQRDVDVLQRRLATGGGAPAGTAPGAALIMQPEGFAAQLDQRLSALETQSRDHTGRIEEIQFKLRQIEGRLDRLVQDVEFRFQQLERGATGQPAPQQGQAQPMPPQQTMQPQAMTPQPAAPAAAAATPPQAVAPPSSPMPAVSPPAAAPSSAAAPVPGPGQQRFVLVPSGTSAQALQNQAAGTAPPGSAAAPAPVPPAAADGRLPAGPPEAQYEFAYGLLVQAQRGIADFAPAEQALKNFVAQNPTHRLAGDAQYWFGETLFARQDWQGAALAFGEGLRRYPNADRAPHNMLGLGRALARLNRKQDACGAFADLARRHPNAARDVRDMAQRERQRIGC